MYFSYIITLVTLLGLAPKCLLTNAFGVHALTATVRIYIPYHAKIIVPGPVLTIKNLSSYLIINSLVEWLIDI